MSREKAIVDKIMKWATNHYWDTLEKDKLIILSHLESMSEDEIELLESEPPAGEYTKGRRESACLVIGRDTYFDALDEIDRLNVVIAELEENQFPSEPICSRCGKPRICLGVLWEHHAYCKS